MDHRDEMDRKGVSEGEELRDVWNRMISVSWEPVEWYQDDDPPDHED